MWTIHEFCDQANADLDLKPYDIISPRTVRWMSAEGLLPVKQGERRSVRYGQEHLDAVRKYRILSKDFKVEQIREIISGYGPNWYELAPGMIVYFDQNRMLPDFNQLVENLRDILNNASKQTGEI